MSLYDGIKQSGGRRFVMALGAGIVNTLLLMGGYIDQGTYERLTIATVALYIAGNGVQKYAQAKHGSPA